MADYVRSGGHLAGDRRVLMLPTIGVSADGRSPESAEIGSPPNPQRQCLFIDRHREEGQMLGLEDFMTIQALVKRCLPL